MDYTGAKLKINKESYTSRVLTFRHHAEHRLPKGRSDMEMQIEMNNDKPGKPPAVISFMIKDIGDDPTDVKMMEQYRVFNKSKIVESLDPQVSLFTFLIKTILGLGYQSRAAWPENHGKILQN